ncbi:hypothetical protein ASF69_18545 [Rhizobium sp. Leaf311]|nr:hypothetical protein ASF69_18545 [Rhizobium sp. Leaf311]
MGKLWLLFRCVTQSVITQGKIDQRMPNETASFGGGALRDRDILRLRRLKRYALYIRLTV